MPQSSSDFTTHSPPDVIVVGSGIGGAMAAHALVSAGLRVLMLERGDWVPRDERNWEGGGTIELSPFHQNSGSFRHGTAQRQPIRTTACVGGQAVFFGGAALRYRVADFDPPPEIVEHTGARWPWGYDTLEPWYGLSESLFDVAGTADDDPTAPPRSAPFPQPSPPLTPVAERIAAAGRSLGLTPSRLPLAINLRGGPRRCRACGTCDSFACGVGAKNDPAAALIPGLLARGLELRTGVTALRFRTRGRQVTELVCYDRASDQRVTLRARAYVLAAGTLSTPRLLLASGLDRLNPAGPSLGRYLLRHCSAVVIGLFPRRVEGLSQFHKHYAFFDYYFGHSGGTPSYRRLGLIQQLHPPHPKLLRAMVWGPLGVLAGGAVSHMAGLVVMAEDQPNFANRIVLDHMGRNIHGQPSALVLHRFSQRDLAARATLVVAAKRILRRAGAALCVVRPIETFTHAVGTVRMGPDPARAPLDGDGAFRGVTNLIVADGSTLPTSAGVNPALTIAATALRAGSRLATTLLRGDPDAQVIDSPAVVGLPRLRMGDPDSR